MISEERKEELKRFFNNEISYNGSREWRNNLTEEEREFVKPMDDECQLAIELKKRIIDFYNGGSGNIDDLI